MDIGKIFSFSGRAGRIEYIGVHILLIMLILLPYLVLFGGSANSSSLSGIMDSIGSSILLYLLLFLPIIWIDFAVMFRRLHDINQPGWVYLIVFFITFIPIIGLIVYILFFLTLLFWPGNSHKNRFDLVDCPSCGVTNSQVSEKCLSCNANLKENNQDSSETISLTKEKEFSLNFEKIITDLDTILFDNYSSSQILDGLKLINNLSNLELNSLQSNEINTRITKLFSKLENLDLKNVEILKSNIDDINSYISTIPNGLNKSLSEYNEKMQTLNEKFNDAYKTNILKTKLSSFENYELAENINVLKKYIYGIDSFKNEINITINQLEVFSNENNLETISNELEKKISDVEKITSRNTLNVINECNNILNDTNINISIKVHLKEILTNSNFLFEFDSKKYTDIFLGIKKTNSIFFDLKNTFEKLENLDLDLLYSDFKLLERELKNRNKKRMKLVYIAVSAIVFAIFVKITIEYYAEYKQEQEILEKKEQIRLENEKRIQEEKQRKEKKRANENIKRVENSIFIQDLILNFESKINEELASKVVDINEEAQYQNLFKNRIKDFKNSSINEINKICTKEAGKETSAIKTCVYNNELKLDTFVNLYTNKISLEISNRIYDIKINNRDIKIDEKLKNLKSELNEKENIYNDLQLKLDDYYLGNKKVSGKLKSEVSELKYEIDNLNHKINYLKDIKNSSKLDFSEPSELKKEIKKEFVQPKIIETPKITIPKNEIKQNQDINKNESKNNIKNRIKDLQEKIDDAFINGEKPNPVLIKELEELKKQQ